MLDVRPVDISSGERQVCLDRLARVRRIADDEAPDDVHAVTVEEVNGPLGRIADGAAASPVGILGVGLEERQILGDDVLDPQEHVPEAGSRA